MPGKDDTFDGLLFAQEIVRLHLQTLVLDHEPLAVQHRRQILKHDAAPEAREGLEHVRHRLSLAAADVDQHDVRLPRRQRVEREGVAELPGCQLRVDHHGLVEGLVRLGIAGQQGEGVDALDAARVPPRRVQVVRHVLEAALVKVRAQLRLREVDLVLEPERRSGMSARPDPGHGRVRVRVEVDLLQDIDRRQGAQDAEHEVRIGMGRSGHLLDRQRASVRQLLEDAHGHGDPDGAGREGVVHRLLRRVDRAVRLAVQRLGHRGESLQRLGLLGRVRKSLVDPERLRDGVDQGDDVLGCGLEAWDIGGYGVYQGEDVLWCRLEQREIVGLGSYVDALKNHSVTPRPAPAMVEMRSRGVKTRRSGIQVTPRGRRRQGNTATRQTSIMYAEQRLRRRKPCCCLAHLPHH